MFCNKCGQELLDGAKFCSYCGNQINIVDSANENIQYPAVIQRYPQMDQQYQGYNEYPADSQYQGYNEYSADSQYQSYNEYPADSQYQSYNEYSDEGQNQGYNGYHTEGQNLAYNKYQDNSQQFNGPDSFAGNENADRNTKSFNAKFNQNGVKNWFKALLDKLRFNDMSKNKRTLIISLAGLFAVLLIVGLIFLFSGIGSKNSGDAYVYASDKELFLVKNPNKPIPISLGKTKCQNEDLYSQVYFSPSGKYVYFFRDAEISDSNQLVGTLYKARISKLKGNSKDEKYIEEIDDDVTLELFFVNDEKIIYRNENNGLYYYNGKESEKIDKSVTSVYETEDDYIVYLKLVDEEKYMYDLYIAPKNNPLDSQELDSDVGYISFFKDKNSIFYEKDLDPDDMDDYSMELYVAGLDRSPTDLGQEYMELDSWDIWNADKVGSQDYYYAVYSDDTVSLYDLVDTDDCDDDDFIDALKDKDNDVKLIDLYRWNDGDPKLIADNIINLVSSGNCFIYNTMDTIEKIDYDEVYEMYDSYDYDFEEYGVNISNLLSVFQTENNMVMSCLKGELYQLEDDANDIFMDSSKEYSVYKVFEGLDGMYIYHAEDEELYILGQESGKLTTTELVCDDCKIIDVVNGRIFFTDDTYYSDDTLYMNINEVKKGDTYCLAEDVISYGASLYEDGLVLGRTDKDTDKEGNVEYEISVFVNEDDKGSVIDDEVREFVRINNKTIVFISGDDLYTYSGKESNKIDSDAVRIYPQN
ncbi:MAG: zinc ribbon domain-containing protein, partial [Eubacterium sp.]|nr:zinc ribbon domain-containing protein [Eubacterium sp.]